MKPSYFIMGIHTLVLQKFNKFNSNFQKYVRITSQPNLLHVHVNKFAVMPHTKLLQSRYSKEYDSHML